MNNKPTVVISRCIEHDACRWNGLTIASPIIRSLMPFINFIPVCPEVEIGLGVPRKPISLIERDGKVGVECVETGENHTAKMVEFSDRFLSELPAVQGFILKSKSPSCGIKNSKVHSPKGYVLSGKGVGMFAEKVLNYSPLIAVEDETRLLNLRIREHFLTKLYTLFRLASINKDMKSLIDFHSRNKYLFMAYNQEKQKQAGVVIANHQKNDVIQVYRDYSLLVAEILQQMPRNSKNINVLLHLFGYFSKSLLNSSEKELFLDLIERYRAFQVPLIALTSIIKVWIAKYDTEYLVNQTYLQPFPKDLETIFDSGKGRLSKEGQ